MYFTQELLQSLHTNQRLLVEELLKYDIKVTPIDISIELIEAEYQGHKEYILDRFCSNVPYVQAQMTSDKILTKKLLQRNCIPTPRGEVFDADEKTKALLYAEKNLQFPIVIKPNWGSHGDYIILDIENQEKLNQKIDEFLHETGGSMPFIIEEQFS
jgi:carbamoylphosphate synthase large subunit